MRYNNGEPTAAQCLSDYKPRGHSWTPGKVAPGCPQRPLVSVLYPLRQSNAPFEHFVWTSTAENPDESSIGKGFPWSYKYGERNFPILPRHEPVWPVRKRNWHFSTAWAFLLLPFYIITMSEFLFVFGCSSSWQSTCIKKGGRCTWLPNHCDLCVHMWRQLGLIRYHWFRRIAEVRCF